MKSSIIVGTHHKTGTHWMKGVFEGFALDCGVPFIHMSNLHADAAVVKANQVLDAGRKVIFFHDHSEFPNRLFSDDIRGIRMIRDPRDVVISALNYHLHTPAKWVHKPAARFENKSLRQMLESLTTYEDRLRYEFEKVLLKNFQAMSDNSRYGSMTTVKYEELMSDYTLLGCLNMARLLELSEVDSVILAANMWDGSLFGSYSGKEDKHVNDGSNQQFRTKFPPELLADFNSFHRALIDKLGYTESDLGKVQDALSEPMSAKSPVMQGIFDKLAGLHLSADPKLLLAEVANELWLNFPDRKTGLFYGRRLALAGNQELAVRQYTGMITNRENKISNSEIVRALTVLNDAISLNASRALLYSLARPRHDTVTVLNSMERAFAKAGQQDLFRSLSAAT